MQVISPIHNDIKTPDPIAPPEPDSDSPEDTSVSPADENPFPTSTTVTTQTTASPTPASSSESITHSNFRSLPDNTPAWQRVSFLLPEYLVALYSGLIAIVTLGALTFGVLNSLIYPDKADSRGFLVYLLATLLVSLPLFVVFKLRIVGTDNSQFNKWNLRTSNFFLALTLFTIATIGISLTIWLLYIIFELIGGTSSLAGKSLTLTLLGLIQGIAWAIFGIKELSKLRTHPSSHLSSFIFIGLSVLIVILTLAFPLRLERAATLDRRTTSDLSTLETAINSYTSSSSKGSLPGSLSDLKDLDEGVSARLSNYTYNKKSSASKSSYYSSASYELCANFETDTKKEAKNGKADLLSSYTSLSGGQFSSHKKGKECFTLSSYGSYSSSIDDTSLESSSSKEDSSSLLDSYYDSLEKDSDSSSTLEN